MLRHTMHIRLTPNDNNHLSSYVINIPQTPPSHEENSVVNQVEFLGLGQSRVHDDVVILIVEGRGRACNCSCQKFQTR